MAKAPKKAKKTNRISEKQKQLNQEYNKHLKRIRSFIKEAQKRGYRFYTQVVSRKKNKRTGEDEIVFPIGAEDWKLPDRPKKVTEASIRRLDKIRPEYLYQRSLYSDPETDEIFTGQEGRQLENKIRSTKSAVTRAQKATQKWTEPEPDSEYEADYDLWYDYEHGEATIDDMLRSSLPDTPVGNPFEYIYYDIQQMLMSLMPDHTKYSSRGRLWHIEEYKNQYSNVLVTEFRKIREEEELNDTDADYAMYLIGVKEDISHLVDVVTPSSKEDDIRYNCEAILKLLNRGEQLGPHTSDAIQRYMLGEVDEYE